MMARHEPDAVLAAIPGWQGASWSKLAGGLNNKTYRVELHGQRGVLKIDDAERDATFNRRIAESSVQSIAADAGLASRVLYASERVYLSEFVEGAVWTRTSLDQEGSLETIAEALRRLHSLPLTGRLFGPVAAANRYVQRIDNADQQVLDHCARIVAASTRPKRLCCCHNDLVVENLISTPALKFLDWEYACDNDPLFDLATIVEHHELSAAQSRRLLAAYCNGNVNRSGAGDDKIRAERLAAGFAEQRTLYLALLWLWLASRSDVVSSGDDTLELQRVGERVITSCS